MKPELEKSQRNLPFVHVSGSMINFKGTIDSRKSKKNVSLEPHLNPLFFVAFSRRDLQHIPLLFVQASHLQIHEFHQVTSYTADTTPKIKRDALKRRIQHQVAGVIRESLIYWRCLKIKNQGRIMIFCRDHCSPHLFQPSTWTNLLHLLLRSMRDKLQWWEWIPRVTGRRLIFRQPWHGQANELLVWTETHSTGFLPIEGLVHLAIIA